MDKSKSELRLKELRKNSQLAKTLYILAPNKKGLLARCALLPYTLVYSEHCPDIIIILRKDVYYQNILKIRKRYGWKPVLFSVSMEKEFSCSYLDFTHSYNHTNKRNCLFNIALTSSHFPYMLNRQLHPDMQVWHATKKKKFCNFIYSDDLHTQTYIRRNFCTLLAQYRRVDCPASSLNNMTRIARYAVKEDEDGGKIYAMKEKRDFMSSYKFSITFEHSSHPNYLTEKIFDALLTGSIPIYWGCPQVAKYYNPEAFINCHDYPSFSSVVEKVKEVDSNPHLYQKYLDAPAILPSSHFYNIQTDIKKQCQTMFDEALARRKRKPQPFIDAWRLAQLMSMALYLKILHAMHILKTAIVKKLK